MKTGFEGEKKINWLTILAVIILSLLFVVASFAQSNNEANVNRVEGLYIFILSEPQNKYIYLGSEKIKVALTGYPKELLNTMIKKVKRNYPEADAILFKSIEMDEADAIKFEK